MEFSFIIPALDEEKNIKKAVSQFSSLKGKYNYEVIVADGGSLDRTIKIAKEAGAIVVRNKRKSQNIAKNRNLGAKKAKGDILIFCDADTQIADLPRFSEKILSVLDDKRIVSIVPKIQINPKEKRADDIFIDFIFGPMVWLTVILNMPFVGGQCQIVKKEAFWQAGGYDEFRVHGEDTFLAKKLAKAGKLIFLDDVKIYQSPRRYRKIGYFMIVIISIKSFFSQIFLKKNIIKKWERTD